MPERTVGLDLKASREHLEGKIALADMAFESSDKPRFVAIGYSDAKDILAALKRAERVEKAARDVAAYRFSHSRAAHEAWRALAAVLESRNG